MPANVLRISDARRNPGANGQMNLGRGQTLAKQNGQRMEDSKRNNNKHPSTKSVNQTAIGQGGNIHFVGRNTIAIKASRWGFVSRSGQDKKTKKKMQRKCWFLKGFLKDKRRKFKSCLSGKKFNLKRLL